MRDKDTLKILFEEWSGEKVSDITAIPQSGSYREYYRIAGLHKTAIGVYNEDLKENRAFLTFTKHFYSLGLRVPKVLAEDEGENFKHGGTTTVPRLYGVEVTYALGH